EDGVVEIEDDARIPREEPPLPGDVAFEKVAVEEDGVEARRIDDVAKAAEAAGGDGGAALDGARQPQPRAGAPVTGRAVGTVLDGPSGGLEMRQILEHAETARRVVPAVGAGHQVRHGAAFLRAT